MEIGHERIHNLDIREMEKIIQKTDKTMSVIALSSMMTRYGKRAWEFI